MDGRPPTQGRVRSASYSPATSPAATTPAALITHYPRLTSGRAGQPEDLSTIFAEDSEPEWQWMQQRDDMSEGQSYGVSPLAAQSHVPDARTTLVVPSSSEDRDSSDAPGGEAASAGHTFALEQMRHVRSSGRESGSASARSYGMRDSQRLSMPPDPELDYSADEEEGSSGESLDEGLGNHLHEPEVAGVRGTDELLEHLMSRPSRKEKEVQPPVEEYLALAAEVAEANCGVVLTPREKLKYAVDLVRAARTYDSFSLLLAPTARRCLHWYLSPWVGRILVLVSLFQLSLAVWEPATYRVVWMFPWLVPRLAAGFDLLCCAVYFGYLALCCRAFGTIDYLRRVYASLLLLACVLMCVDAGMALCFGVAVRWSRCLRAVPPVCFVKQFRSAVRTCLRTMPNVMDVLFLLLVVMVIFAIVGVSLFGLLYDGRQATFDNFGQAMLSLTVLLTTENYPDIMLPAFRESAWSVLYFVLYMLIGIYILLTVLQAVVFENFKGNYLKLCSKRTHQRHLALLAAFYQMAVGDHRFLAKDEFTALLHASELDDEDLDDDKLFKALDKNHNQQIEVKEFMLFVERSQRHRVRTALSRRRHTCEGCLDTCCYWCYVRPPSDDQQSADPNPSRGPLISLLESEWSRRFSALLIVANTVVLAVQNPRLPISTQDILTIIDVCFVAVFAVELLVKLYAYRISNFFFHPKDAVWNCVDFVVILVSIVFAVFDVVLLAIGSQESASQPWFNAIRVLRLLRVVRTIRLARIDQRVEVLLQTLSWVVPVLQQVGGLIFLVIYFFAIIGMQAFSLQMQPNQLQYLYLNPLGNFNTFGQALVGGYHALVVIPDSFLFELVSLCTLSSACILFSSCTSSPVAPLELVSSCTLVLRMDPLPLV
jgi:Ion transport protein